MYATTFEAVNSVGLPARPREAPAKQSNTREAELVARLKAGNQTAFRELVERYQSKIRNITLGILGSREDADEIAQEVFAKVYFALPSFDARSSLYTWIYRIAVNECYGFLRKRRLTLVYGSDSPDDILSTSMQDVADPRPVTDAGSDAAGLCQQTAGSRSGRRPAPAAVERGGGLLAGRVVRDDRLESEHPKGSAVSDPSKADQSGSSA